MKKDNAKEPDAVYSVKQNSVFHNRDEYVSLEEFRVEAKKRARKFLKDHGIDK